MSNSADHNFSSKGNGRTQIIPIREEHIKHSVTLFVRAYCEARHREPLLPSRHEDVQAILPLLQGLARNHAGVVAIRGGEVVGFLVGQVLESFRGKKTVYVPEFAHAAVAQGRQDIYQAMYEAISASWVANGCGCHLITILENQPELVKAFFWLEFGMTAVDAMRSLSPVPFRSPEVHVRQARPDDIDAVVFLANALQHHLAGPPIFKIDSELVRREDIADRLRGPAQACWLAWHEDEPVAYCHIQGANTSASYIISDPRTASVKAAFTKEPFRGRGVGLALLNRCMEWATTAGYGRCAVDFEPQNTHAARFWMKRFHPVCYTLIRYVQEESS